MNIFKKFVNKLIQLQPAREIKDEDLEYILWISNLYLQVINTPGHIAEVGVANGRNTILFSRLIQMHGDSSIRQYLGFDTFDGFTNDDLERDEHLAQTNNRWKAFSKKGVLERCVTNGVENEVEIFEGDATSMIIKVLSSHNGKKFQPGKARFALVYIDCNAYRPALKSMEAFLPHMSPGSIFAIDEKLQGGETEAMLEFAKVHNFLVEKPGRNQVPMIIRIPNKK